MPLYDVQCDACGVTVEEFQAMHAPQPTKCPACGAKKAHRVILQCPGIHTDCSYYKGSDDGLPKNERLRQIYLANARKVGVDPTGKRYEPELVAKGKACGLDPDAWVPEMEGRSHIKRVLRKRRWSAQGRVEVKAPSYEIPDDKVPYRPAPDIVEGVIRRELRENKATISRKEYEAKKEEVSKQLAGVWG